MPVEAGVDYWPVAGVTEPQHHWPFTVTGDYTDQGSTGGLDLTARGSNNSFNNGLVLDGNGWASRSNHADLCNVGSTFSVLIEASFASGGGQAFPLSCINSYLTVTDGYDLNFDLLSNMRFQADGTNSYFTWANFGITPEYDTIYQFVYVYTGGNLYAYIDGIASSTNPVTRDAPNSSSYAFTVGAYAPAETDGSYQLKGKVRRVGILKGTAWSADDVSAIYAAL